jgi:hypothetical protein
MYRILVSTITKITFSKDRLFAGKPYCYVNGDWWDGFHSVRGVVFVKVGPKGAWIEHHGDVPDLIPGGGEIVDSGEREQWGFNYWISGMKERLFEHPTLWYGAVNKGRIRQGRSAITAYNQDREILTDFLRFEGEVWSATIKPPAQGHPEPLNWWIETSGLVEF